jgi:hypothetical protein
VLCSGGGNNCGIRGQAHKAAIVDEGSEEDTDEEEEQEPDLGHSDSGDEIPSDDEESEGKCYASYCSENGDLI